MTDDTIWDEWDRSRLSSLHRRHEEIEAGNPTADVILPADLEAIIDGNEACVPDKLLREYLLKALRGELKRSRGRQRVRIPDLVLEAISQIIDEDAAAIAAGRKSGAIKHSRGDPTPKEAAVDDLAGMFGNVTGLTLLNRISKHRKRHKLK
jgi:hypothetical protein